jgi:hypothetical protein
MLLRKAFRNVLLSMSQEVSFRFRTPDFMSSSLAELGEKLKDLQGKSCEFSSFIEQVQASIPEVQDIRRIVAKTTTSLVSLERFKILPESSQVLRLF